jgi:anti-sigma factor RsiW
MNCRSCSEALTALLDNELALDEQEIVQSHLSGCPECKKEYDSLHRASRLTERVEPVPFNPALWNRIQSEISAQRSGPMAFVRTLFLPLWRPAMVAAGALLIALLLFVSFPSSSIDPALEEEFTQFMKEREAISLENRRILFEPRANRDHRGGNPFVSRVSYERSNPFQE